MQTVAEPYTKRKRILTVQYGKAAYCAGGSVMPIVPSSRVRLLASSYFICVPIYGI
jgi:hypothetical protein